MTDPRLKIAVFVDFDNIEIGVKTTLNQPFDIGVVLEAIKERGEVVTKVAYSDWKRAGDYSRQLSQHAIRMVQRNLTPGGDKNGADINLALDALEMAFTHDHINAFVIVGGDSDFMTLVEKLKQYDKKVFVVGGRQFTSLVMQKNCHEFIAYENLVSARRSTGTGRSRTGGTSSAAADLDKALPLVKRALKVLADREVTPQLGLLKSTLLQLDSTFSERNYGASTFRDFIEKVAESGLVSLKQSGRSVLVELSDSALASAVPDREPSSESHAPIGDGAPQDVVAASSPEPRESRQDEAPVETPRPAMPSEAQQAESVEFAAQLFARAKQTPRWPMYVRQIRQYFRNADETFDERKLGFPGIVEFLRACQKDGLLRLERDRQGVMRVFPGAKLQRPAPAPVAEPGNAAEPMSETRQPDDEPELPLDDAAPRSVFTRVIDDVPGAVERPLAATTTDEEDLSVGPGNVEQNDSLMPVRRARKSPVRAAGRTAASPRTAAPRTAAPRTARGTRTPRPRKPKA